MVVEAYVNEIDVSEGYGVVLMEVEVGSFPCDFGGDMRYCLVPVKNKLVKMKVFLVRVFVNMVQFNLIVGCLNKVLLADYCRDAYGERH